MTHTTQIISTRQASDESIAVKIRCCANPATDSVLTIYGVGQLLAEQLTEYIDQHHDRVAAKCQGMTSGKQLLYAVAAKTKIHEG